MSAPVVNVTNIAVLNNPANFTDEFQFEITFECLKPLSDDLEWKLTYVGCAENEKYDQELESVLVGPVPLGVNKFVFQAECPDVSRIPPQDVLGVTVVLITCLYKAKQQVEAQEFIRVGYYVNNAYNEPELEETPPERPIVEKLRREILADKPRVTRFPIEWD